MLGRWAGTLRGCQLPSAEDVDVWSERWRKRGKHPGYQQMGASVADTGMPPRVGAGGQSFLGRHSLRSGPEVYTPARACVCPAARARVCLCVPVRALARGGGC